MSLPNPFSFQLTHRIDREHDGFIAIEDLHLFFGEEISV